MKKLLFAASLVLVSLLSAAAQNTKPWTVHRIAERWSYEEVPMPEIKGKPGVFTYESTAPVVVACFISDKTATNVRNAPGGKVVGKIPKPGTYSLTICNPTNGWWQILNGIVSDDLEGNYIEFEEDVWVHYSVLGIGTRNYDGQVLPLRAAPRTDAAVTGQITRADVTVRPLDMTEDGEWVKVNWNGQAGWIEHSWLCGNPLTTCS